jgi:hypothetical protein
MACTQAPLGPFSSRHKGHEWRNSPSCYRWWSTLRGSKCWSLGGRLSSPCRTGECAGAQEGRIYQDTPGLISMSRMGRAIHRCRSGGPWVQHLPGSGISVRQNAAAEAREKDKRCSFKADFKGVEAKSSFTVCHRVQARWAQQR